MDDKSQDLPNVGAVPEAPEELQESKGDTPDPLDHTENADGTRNYPAQKPVETVDKPA